MQLENLRGVGNFVGFQLLFSANKAYLQKSIALLRVFRPAFQTQTLPVDKVTHFQVSEN